MFEGGAYLGTKRIVPAEDLYGLAAKNLGKHNVDALIIIGGFEVCAQEWDCEGGEDIV